MRKTLQHDYLPSTFLDRGVAIPFTTPDLLGARARPGPRGRLEFVISNPGGGRGNYVMGWESLSNLARVTVHDRLLHDRIAELPMIVPSAIRRVADEVAVSGSAGRPAAKAAEMHRQREEADRLMANYLMTIRLLESGGMKGVDWRALDPGDRALRAKARALIARLAPQFALSGQALFDVIESLSVVIAAIGFANQGYRSRLPELLASVTRLQTQMSRFTDDDTDARPAAAMISDVARLTIDIGTKVLDACHAEVDNPVTLVGTWQNERDRLLDQLTRPDWILDGWGLICALWENALSADREIQRSTIIEIQRMVPVMPKEASNWVEGGYDEALQKDWFQRRWVKLNTDWRTGEFILEMTARNELVKAL